MNIKGKKGITLIALVITIVILIILAGVVISLSFGENSLLNRAKEARQKYEIAEAKEYIEMKINECTIDKDGNASMQDIVDYLAEDSNVTYYVALEEIALVAGKVDIGTPKEIYVVYNRYQFKIEENKNVEFISIVDVDLEGQVTIEAEVQEHLGKNENGNYTARVLLKATGEAEIAKLEIQNPDGTILELLPDGLTTVGKDMTIEFDKEYKVILTTENGHKYTKKIIERAEETIITAEELASFRDRVNSGLTYEGKIVKLGADIDLSTVCGENVNGEEISWEPIYNYAGIFDGNYHEIKKLYINSNNKQYHGLFNFNTGTIQNVVLSNVYIYVDLTNSQDAASTSSTIGSLVSYNSGEINNCGVESGGIICINTKVSNIKYREMVIGAIAGHNRGSISNCYNKSNISVTSTTSYSNSVHPHNSVGGIVGLNFTNAKLCNCYNTGVVESYNAYMNMVGGICGRAYLSEISNVYNCNKVIGTSSYSTYNFVCGILGQNYIVNGQTILSKIYCINSNTYSHYILNESYSIQKYKNGIVDESSLQTLSSTLGDAFTDDIQNKDGTWQYNNGYPILKWQLKKNN